MQVKIPKTAITETKLRKLMTEAIGPESTGTAWAKENGMTPQQVSAFDRKIQGPGLKIPEVLGYKPQTIWIPIDEEEIYTKPPVRGKVGPTKDQIMAEEAKSRKKNKALSDKRVEKAARKDKKDKKKKKKSK